MFYLLSMNCYDHVIIHNICGEFFLSIIIGLVLLFIKKIKTKNYTKMFQAVILYIASLMTNII